MDTAAHQVTRSIVHQTMAGECAFSDKRHCHNIKLEVATFARASVSGVAVRFVLDGQDHWRQSSQTLAQQVDGCSVHQAGSTFLNGLTVTFS